MGKPTDKSGAPDLFDWMSLAEYWSKHYHGEITLAIEHPEDARGNAVLRINADYFCGRNGHARNFLQLHHQVPRPMLRHMFQYACNLGYEGIEAADGSCYECKAEAALH